jgi:hypothetical protein
MKSEHKPSRGLTPTVLPRSGIAMENPNLVLFYLKYGCELNTKKVEDFLIFPTGHVIRLFARRWVC